MIRFALFICGFLVLNHAVLVDCQAGELKTRYALVTYENQDLLREFNDNLRIGYKLYQYVKRRANYTLTDEVKNKIDVVLEKVEVVLDMFPRNVSFNIVLLPDDEDIRKIHQNVYHSNASYIAFFSPKKNTVYLSVDDVNLRVLAHEFGHVIVENYFDISPPPKMHELLAQFAAANITD